MKVNLDAIKILGLLSLILLTIIHLNGTKPRLPTAKEVIRITPKDELEEMIDDSIIKMREERAKINYNIPLSKEVQLFTWELARNNNMDLNLIYAMIKCESNFNPKAIGKNSKSQDVGMLQINTINHVWGETLLEKPIDYFDECDNIEVGVEIYVYYREYWRRKGYSGEELVIRALNTYNWGLGGYKGYMSKGNSYDSWYYGNKIIKTRKEMESGIFEY